MSQVANNFVPEPKVVDGEVRRSAIARARERGIVLPTFAELAGNTDLPGSVARSIGQVGPDEARPENLWRVNWYNAPDRIGRVAVPEHLVLPKALTGVDATIVVLIGSRFPMIGAHKVLPAYAGLVTRLVTGSFDPARHRAVWPSTGNYCRGGIAISRILGCDGIAVLPEGMSKERYEWLAQWTTDPSHIVRTVGTESNVKEIYDKCHELAKVEENVILNQFSAFANYIAHYSATGEACERVFNHLANGTSARLATFVAATGSAGTIAAGDYLKKQFASKIAAVEALECPTMLENGYGEHNIQGIGDKHIPLIHNVTNMDFVVGVSDQVTDRLNVLCNSETGRAFLSQREGLGPALVDALGEVGLSGWANIVAAIKLARSMDYGPDDVVMTIATDSARLYATEMAETEARLFPHGLGATDAAEIFGTCLGAPVSDHVLELGDAERRRIFNLGYYTWVEQQGVSVEDFDRRRDQSFWQDLAATVPAWDALIHEFNAETGIN